MVYTTQRKAFSMLTAIMVIVLMASVGAFVMSLSGKMVKTTTTQFQREQAELLAKSYTEYAIMAVMANDAVTTNNCVETINGTNIIRPQNNGGFNVTVQIAYIGTNTQRVTNCSAIRQFSSAVVTTDSPLNVMIDVYIRYQDLDGVNTNWITYHKRTLQKI